MARRIQFTTKYPKIITDFLNIKPIMSIKKDGTLGPIGVMWGKSNVVEKISKFINKKMDPNKEYDIAIGHSICEQNAEVLREKLQAATDKRIRLNIEEIRVAELDAYLVAQSVADQLERRVAFRRAMKQGVQRTMQRGALGCRIKISGRLGGSEMSRAEQEMQGRVPLHTLRADVDYGLAEAETTFGKIGVKCWIYKGDISDETNPLGLIKVEGSE